MVCDDDPDLLRAYRLALRSKYDVITANSGNECLNKYVESKKEGITIDAMLLDYRLGDLNGDEVASRLKKLNGTKIILISAYDIDSRLINELRSSGVISMFVRKPVTIQALGVALDNTLSM